MTVSGFDLGFGRTVKGVNRTFDRVHRTLRVDLQTQIGHHTNAVLNIPAGDDDLLGKVERKQDVSGKRHHTIHSMLTVSSEHVASISATHLENALRYAGQQRIASLLLASVQRSTFRAYVRRQSLERMQSQTDHLGPMPSSTKIVAFMTTLDLKQPLPNEKTPKEQLIELIEQQRIAHRVITSARETHHGGCQPFYPEVSGFISMLDDVSFQHRVSRGKVGRPSALRSARQQRIASQPFASVNTGQKREDTRSWVGPDISQSLERVSLRNGVAIAAESVFDASRLMEENNVIRGYLFPVKQY
ncbi:hypothetical protein P153DRAFT_412679 [Dothidotthia symphoricarpi CBS 119687]|uniref:Uncharacterized protein n=1 Tax=Dothidotthia symphoricarpi CBS 119687 TaxID=1392245 RepID=A0A6A5ZWH4_9PLEO|nr:uncharacterized protein P153DRAFT_412679 [Dothidotthia symphoricarpi CBS 119687]KAF2123646.1 hypothetical protein P153DRAFT_412679 [Dothidotthia symphoricarpi CBS 119687]